MARTSRSIFAPDLPGRAPELAALRRARAAAMAGATTVVALIGEPGIGKTSLLDALAVESRAAGALVLRGGASEAAGMPPYLPFLEALGAHLRATTPDRLRAQVGELGAILATILPDLPVRLATVVPAFPLPAEQARLRLYEAIGHLLAAIAAEAPLVLILDDLHWADAASLDLLAYLVRIQPALRLLIALAYRPGEAAEHPPLVRTVAELVRLRALTTVELAPLDPPAVAELAAAHLGATPAPALVATLHARSEGNPFFAEELLRGWREVTRDGDEIAPDTGGVPLATPPPTIDAAIDQRLARLPGPTIDLLRTAAVIGRRFDAGLLGAAAGQEEECVEDDLASAVRARLLEIADDGTYRFAHDLVREALYRAVTPARRRRLHSFIGRALEARGNKGEAHDLAGLAFHFARSGDRARGMSYARRAGDQALATYAFDAAVAYFRAALDLCDHTATERGALLINLGEAASLTNAEEEAITAFLAAEEWAGGRGDRVGAAHAAHLAGRSYGRLEQHGGRSHGRLAQHAGARGAYERALGYLSPDDIAARAAITIDLSLLIGVSLTQQQEGVALARRALALAEHGGEQRTIVAARRALGDLLIRGNDFAAGMPLLEAALDAAAAATDMAIAAECCSALFHAHLWLGDLRRAWAMQDRRLDFARRSHDLHQLRHAYPWQAMQAVHQGRWAEAEATLAAAQALVDRLPNPEGRGFLQVAWGTMAWVRGDYETAERHAREAVAIFRALGPWVLLWYLAPLGVILIHRGQPGEARAIFTEVEELLANQDAGTLQVADALTWLGVGATLLSDRALGARVVPRLLPFAGRHTDLLVDRVLGELATMRGDYDAAAGYLATAEVRAHSGQDRIELVNTIAAQGRLARARGGPGALTRAESLLQSALVTYEEIGLGGEARRVREELRQLATATTVSPGRASYPGGLSAREVEVLQLVAEGQSNRAIAATLSLSERTVGNHLTNIFNKLGVDNRAAATAFALRNDLA